MPWSWIVYTALEIITLFIILELLQRRRAFGYEPVVPPKGPNPSSRARPSTAPFVAGLILNHSGATSHTHQAKLPDKVDNCRSFSNVVGRVLCLVLRPNLRHMACNRSK